MGRREVREKVLHTLYELEFQPQRLHQVLAARKENFSTEDYEFFTRLLQGVLQKKDGLDQSITRYLKKGWSLDRISIMERSILRLATYELQYEKDIPQKVVINEAVELSKRYGDTHSRRFINGILGKWVRESQKDDRNG